MPAARAAGASRLRQIASRDLTPTRRRAPARQPKIRTLHKELPLLCLYVVVGWKNSLLCTWLRRTYTRLRADVSPLNEK
eukprot:6199875-Pleurochrysis_carterae.AAC.1